MIPWILFAIAFGLVYWLNRRRVTWKAKYENDILTNKEIHDAYLAVAKNNERDLRVGRDLIKILSGYCGERGDNEGAGETLDRLIRERDSALAEIRELTAALKTRESIVKRLEAKVIDLKAARDRYKGESKDKRERLKRLPSRPKKPLVKKARKA